MSIETAYRLDLESSGEQLPSPQDSITEFHPATPHQNNVNTVRNANFGVGFLNRMYPTL